MSGLWRITSTCNDLAAARKGCCAARHFPGRPVCRRPSNPAASLCPISTFGKSWKIKDYPHGAPRFVNRAACWLVEITTKWNNRQSGRVTMWPSETARWHPEWVPCLPTVIKITGVFVNIWLRPPDSGRLAPIGNTAVCDSRESGAATVPFGMDQPGQRFSAAEGGQDDGGSPRLRKFVSRSASVAGSGGGRRRPPSNRIVRRICS